MAPCWLCCGCRCVAGVRGEWHRALLKQEITCLGSTSMGGTGTTGALPTVPRACGDLRSASLDGLRKSAPGGASGQQDGLRGSSPRGAPMAY